MNEYVIYAHYAKIKWVGSLFSVSEKKGVGSLFSMSEKKRSGQFCRSVR